MSKEFFKDTDLEEVKKIIEFCSNLVIIDKDKANDLETSNSVYAAADMMSVYYNIDDYSEEEREYILNEYVEQNIYYKELETLYGIPPYEARDSQHLHIIKSFSNVLNLFEEELFYECYYDALKYYNEVVGTYAFKFHKNYSEFNKLYIVWCAIQRYLSRKLDTLFEIDSYDQRMLKNSFISLGVDYFDGLPISYQRKLLKNMHDIIGYKGTTQCFKNIIDIFGTDSAMIYNYYLIKEYETEIVNGELRISNKPVLKFYKTPYDQELDTDNNVSFDYRDIISNSPYWLASKEEIITKEFNQVKTNYISINSAMDIRKNSLELSYFFNYLEEAYANGKLKKLEIYNNKISNDPFNIYHALIALMALGLKVNGYKDTIVTNIDSMNYIYGYSNNDNSVNVEKYLNIIKEQLIYDDNISLQDKNSLMNFITSFKINKLHENSYSLQEFLKQLYENNSIRKKLDNFLISINNYEINKALRKIKDLEMRTMVTNKIFKNYETYSDYLLYNSPPIYNYISIIKNNITDYTQSQREEYYYSLRDKMNELISVVSEHLYNEDLSNAISKNTFFGINSYLEYYIKTLIILFKSYSMQLIDEDSNIYNINDRNEGFQIIDKLEKDYYKSDSDYFGILDSCFIEGTSNGKSIERRC